MTAAQPQGARRWLLHPLGPALALAVTAVTAVAAAAAALRDVLASAALLACVAGCAAGFANSGST